MNNRRMVLTATWILAAWFLLPVPGLSAQDYSLLGSLALRGLAHLPSGETATSIGSWEPQALLDLKLDHSIDLDRSRLAVQHRMIAQPLPVTGSAGTPSEVIVVQHLLYRAYLDLYLSDSATVSLGRQRVNWGKGYAFTATDAFHPVSQGIDSLPILMPSIIAHGGDADLGFDGVAFQWLPTADASVDVAVAAQQALLEESLEALRFAVNGNMYWNGLEPSVSVVYQEGDILRPGVALSGTVAGLLLSGEVAWEFQDPEHLYRPVTVWNAALEYSLAGDTWDLTAITEVAHTALSGDSQAPFWTLASLSFSSGSAWSMELVGLHEVETGVVVISHTSTLTTFDAVDLEAHVAATMPNIDDPEQLDLVVALTGRVNF